MVEPLRRRQGQGQGRRSPQARGVTSSVLYRATSSRDTRTPCTASHIAYTEPMTDQRPRDNHDPKNKNK